MGSKSHLWKISLSDGQDDLSNSMNDVGLKGKKLEHEGEGKHLLKEEKNEKNSERTEEKINLNKQLKQNPKKKKLKSLLTLKMFSFKRSKMHSLPSLIQ